MVLNVRLGVDAQLDGASGAVELQLPCLDGAVGDFEGKGVVDREGVHNVLVGTGDLGNHKGMGGGGCQARGSCEVLPEHLVCRLSKYKAAIQSVFEMSDCCC